MIDCNQEQDEALTVVEHYYQYVSWNYLQIPICSCMLHMENRELWKCGPSSHTFFLWGILILTNIIRWYSQNFQVSTLFWLIIKIFFSLYALFTYYSCDRNLLSINHEPENLLDTETLSYTRKTKSFESFFLQVTRNY